MTYAIKLDRQVVKYLDKLDSPTKERIKRRLRKLHNLPYRFLERVVGRTFSRLRIGEYRAFVDVDEKEKVILVRYIDHRRRVYKR